MLGQNATSENAIEGSNLELPIPAVQGAYTLTGKAVTWGRSFAPVFGTFALAGQAVTWARGLFSASGSYVLSGQVAGAFWFLNVAFGAYSLAGKAASWGRGIGAAVGHYVLTGFTVVVPGTRILTALGGRYVVGSVGAALRLVRLVSRQRTIAAGLTALRAVAPSLSRLRSVSSALSKLRNHSTDLRR